MKQAALLLAGILCLPLTASAGAPPLQKDDPNCKDHPLITRMPDYYLRGCTEHQFDAFEFTTGRGKKTSVEGQLWKMTYYPQNTPGPKASDLQILRNYENALKAKGGTVVWSEKGKETLKLVQAGKEAWIEVAAEFTGKYWVTIVQKGEMKQDVTADLFATDLKASGHTAVYGILFDTGKSDIKPESKPAIAEVAKLLQGDPALKLFVVGHTDNVGGVESNLKLSQDRAAAVVKALVSDHGVAAARLLAHGSGQFAPVASNDDEDGRAKNRRVELVKQ